MGLSPMRPQAAPTCSLEFDRRTAMILTSSLVTSFLLSYTGPASAEEQSFFERGMSKYIKKRRLDPLDTYVPLVIEAREQLVTAEKTQVSDPEFTRSLLRGGAFVGMRENVRVLGEYAVINGKAEQAAPLVNGFFRAVEDYDLVLALSVREKKDVNGEEASTKLKEAVKALDALLATVPTLDYERAQRVLAVARAKQRAAEQELAAAEAPVEAIPIPSP